MDYIPLSIIRTLRNQLLQASDIYVLPDYPHSSPDVRQEWIDYRRNLRDITKDIELSDDGTSAKVVSVPWPAKPSVDSNRPVHPL